MAANRTNQTDILKGISENLSSMVQVLQRLQTIVRESLRPRVSESEGENPEPRPSHAISYLHKFLELRPPTFQGSPDPTVALGWLSAIEKIFKVMKCPQEEKVELAEHQLEGEAKYWWKSAKRLLEARKEELNWESFERIFNEKYIPSSIKKEMEAEFLRLSQGSMTAAEYEYRFQELSKFSSYLNRHYDEEWKADLFQRGLMSEIRHQVTLLELTSFAESAHKAQLAKKAHLERRAIKEKRKRDQGETSRDNKKPANNLNTGKTPATQCQPRRTCEKCGRFHGNKPCMAGKAVCFKCFKPGHIARNCTYTPEQPRAQVPGGVFTPVQRETNEYPNLGQGMFRI